MVVPPQHFRVVRQSIIRRKKAMGEALPLFANEIDIRDYRYSAWITSSKESPYEVWTLCKPRAETPEATRTGGGPRNRTVGRQFDMK
jgi:hypothetical protein